MYHTEDNNSNSSKTPYDDKEINRLSCCAIVIIVGFLFLIASLAGWFSVTFLGGD